MHQEDEKLLAKMIANHPELSPECLSNGDVICFSLVLFAVSELKCYIVFLQTGTLTGSLKMILLGFSVFWVRVTCQDCHR